MNKKNVTVQIPLVIASNELASPPIFKMNPIWVAQLRVLAKPCLFRFIRSAAKQSDLMGRESQIASSSTPRNDGGG